MAQMALLEEHYQQLSLDNEMLDATCQSIAMPPPIPARSPLRLSSVQVKPISYEREIRSSRLSIDTTAPSYTTTTAYQQVIETSSLSSDDDSVPELDSPKDLIDSSRTSKSSSPGPSTPDTEYPLDMHLFSQYANHDESCLGMQYEEPLPGLQSPYMAVAPSVPNRRKIRTRSRKTPSFLMLLDDHASASRSPSRASFSHSTPQTFIPEQYEQYHNHSRQRQSLPLNLPSHPAVHPISRDGTNRLVARQESSAVIRSRPISVSEIDRTYQPPTPSIRQSSIRTSYHHRLRDSLDLTYAKY